MAENSSSGASFETNAFVMSNSVARRSRSRTAACLARKPSTATANSVATRSRNSISAGLGSYGATELKPNAPSRFSPAVRGTSIRVLSPNSRRERLAGTHVVRLYQRIKRAKNHQKAVVAVARHLAEATWWVLTKQEVYREPLKARQALSSTHAVSAFV